MSTATDIEPVLCPAAPQGQATTDACAYVTALLAALDDASTRVRFLASFVPGAEIRMGNTAWKPQCPVESVELCQVMGYLHTRHQVLKAVRWQDEVFAEVTVQYEPEARASVVFPALLRIRLNAQGRITALFMAMDRSMSHPLRDLPEVLGAGS